MSCMKILGRYPRLFHGERTSSIVSRASGCDHLRWENIRPNGWWYEWVLRHVSMQRIGWCRIHAHLASVIWSDAANKAICSVEEASQFYRSQVFRCFPMVGSWAVDQIAQSMWMTGWLDERSRVQLANVSSDHWGRWMYTEHQRRRDTTISQLTQGQRYCWMQC